MQIRFVRTMTFSSSHRYFNPQFSEQDNRKLYGSLYREDGFGHDFHLEAHFTGQIDPLTGMIVNLVDVDRWLMELKRELDHRHLNDLPAFASEAESATAVPTPELIARYCYQELEKKVTGHSSGARLFKVRLHEGDQLWVDYHQNASSKLTAPDTPT